jgi:dihydroorotate dehydrogenase electron transfer subunit
VTVAPRHAPSPVSGRPGDGPVQGRFEVVGHRQEGAYRVLTVAAPRIAEHARPGQFVGVAAEGPGTLLRRPFSIAATGQGTVSVVYDVHGPGTTWLAGVPLHATLDVVGPLGTAFPLPRQSVPCLLVAGGYGAAPLFWLGEELRAAGMRVDIVNGAATKDRIHGLNETKRVALTYALTTDDGSYGVHGRVTDVLEERVEATKAAVVYAVGPMGMLRAVAEECTRLGVSCQVSVEELMACGVGVCWTCVVPTVEEDGSTAHRRSCLDGPVFPATRIDWEASRWTVGPPVAPEDDEPAAPSRPTDEELFG